MLISDYIPDYYDVIMILPINATASSDEMALTTAKSTMRCFFNCLSVIRCVAFNYRPSDGSCELLLYTQTGLVMLDKQDGVISGAVNTLT